MTLKDLAMSFTILAKYSDASYDVIKLTSNEGDYPEEIFVSLAPTKVSIKDRESLKNIGWVEQRDQFYLEMY